MASAAGRFRCTELMDETRTTWGQYAVFSPTAAPPAGTRTSPDD
ncbi:hypothetical protein [Brevibacterium samyangense]